MTTYYYDDYRYFVILSFRNYCRLLYATTVRRH